MSLSSLISGESDASADRPVVETAERDREPTAGGLTDERSFRIGRVLYGGVLAFMAIDNLRNLEERIAYAESSGAPRPEVAVPAISSSLLAGGVGVALWRFPAAAASAAAAFFVSVTPVMHDFWSIEDPEQRQSQQIHFLKNAALLGASLALLAVGRREAD